MNEKRMLRASVPQTPLTEEEQKSLEKLRSVPKSDLHNHFVLGGNRDYLYRKMGKRINPLIRPLSSMDEMHIWNQKNIGADFDSCEMRRLLINATFQQAKEDGVTILEIGEENW